MTNQEKIKIKRIAVSFNTALVVMGLKGLQGSYSNLPVNVKSYGELTSAIKRIMNVPVGMKDVSYFTTSFENWQEVLDVIYNIARRFKWKREQYDCLMPDTPLICKIDDKIYIKEVQELPEFPENTYVLDEKNQWTRINWVKSKKSDKDIIIIKFPEGFLELTEDHRIKVKRDEMGRWIRKWIEIGELEKKKYKKWRFYNQDFAVFENKKYDPELAYAFGIFLAEGCARVSKSAWHIDMGEKYCLERAQKALEKKFGVKMKIVLYPSQKKGSIRGKIKSKKDLYRLKIDAKRRSGTEKRMAHIFRFLFYTESGNKKVPEEILNADNKAKEMFLQGYIDGDGAKHKRGIAASCKSKIALFGLQILAQKIGWDIGIYYDKRTYGNRRGCPGIIFYKNGKKIPRMIQKPLLRRKGGELVYDINTDSACL